MMFSSTAARRGDASASDTLALGMLDLEEDLFQGAPPLPRVDAGDAFDHLLLRWLDSTQQEAKPQQLSQTHLQLEAQHFQPYRQERRTQPYLPPQQQHHAGNLERYDPIPHFTTPLALQPAEIAQHSVQTPAQVQEEWRANNSPQGSQTSNRTPQSSFPLPAPLEMTHPRDFELGSKSNLSNGTLSINPGLALQGDEFTTQDAKRAWTKRKRGPMSDESKEKERARNRRAQKKFREREKERQEQRQYALSVLEAELATLTRENEELARKNASLEQAMALRKEQQRFDAQPALFDGQMYVESHIDALTDLLPRLTVGGEPRTMTQQEVASLNFTAHARLYKQYVEALRKHLEGPDKAERLAELVRELCSLNLAVAMSNPKDFSVFQASQLDLETATPAKPGPSVWRKCLAAVKPSGDQKRALLEERRKYLRRLSPLLKQRWELHRLMAEAFPKPDSTTSDSRVKALEAVEQLRDNLREEQVLLVQAMCCTHQQILAPHQTAINIVTAYPVYPDVPQLVEVIALETPGESTAAEILEVDTLPPI